MNFSTGTAGIQDAVAVRFRSRRGRLIVLQREQLIDSTISSAPTEVRFCSAQSSGVLRIWPVCQIPHCNASPAARCLHWYADRYVG